ncbi:LIM domain-containing protein A-like isoform X2 [Armigeres subalbatus]|uniref:LIM domain-containing protein A-like isoform X2 n=1 Tax=Armigeres subalbatus TaxID=124917 RepID=UPI002ED1B535
MDCCSSNYMDFRHSMNNNFCYPYSPSMIRSASPYPLPPGSGSRYGSDYRGGYYEASSFDKYYGGYLPPSGSGPAYAGNYYGSSYSSYRELAYNEYYHPSSPSSHPFPGPVPGSFHGPHMFNRHQSLPLPFQRESYYHQRDHHPYAAENFSNFSSNPYKRADSNHASSGSTTNSSTGNSTTVNGSCSSPSSSSTAGETPLYGYTHSPDYSAQSYNSGSSPNHPHHHRHHPLPHPSPGEGGGSSYTPSTMPNATGYPHSIKDARIRKLKERKLAKSASHGNGSPNRGQNTNSTSSSPNPGSCGSNSSGTDARLKSLDALASDNYEHDPANNSPSSRHTSPGRSAGPSNSPAGAAAAVSGVSPPKRSKKQTTKHRAAATELDKLQTAPPIKSGDPGNSNASSTPAAGTIDRNVTPLPGFQQAFGSTEIGKFSEAFFNSNSPDPNELHPEGSLPAGHHHHHPHPHHSHHGHPPHPLMMMDSPDVDNTLSPQSWEPTGPGDPYETTSTTTTAFNLQIGTSFHPSYYESPSYASSDHAVDSPLGNYFSEMTCSEYVN